MDVVSRYAMQQGLKLYFFFFDDQQGATIVAAKNKSMTQRPSDPSCWDLSKHFPDYFLHNA